MIGKWLVEHDRELYLNPKFLVMVKAYFSATFSANISDFFNSCLYWVSVVHGLNPEEIEILGSLLDLPTNPALFFSKRAGLAAI